MRDADDGIEVDESVIRSMRVLGAAPEQLALAQQRLAQARERAQQREVFAVWPENLDSVQAFCALAGQWQYASSGLAGSVRTGIPVTAVMALLQTRWRARRRKWQRVLGDLQLMESAVRGADGELAAQKKAEKAEV